MVKITCTKNEQKVRAKLWKQSLLWSSVEIYVDVCSECGLDSANQAWEKFHTIEDEYENEK